MRDYLFEDRIDAGLKLAAALGKYKDNKKAVVIAIPRGGVVVGKVIAKQLHLPLEVEMVKKIGHPYNPELAIGAVSLKSRVLHGMGDISNSYLTEETERIRALLKERYKRYGRKPAAVKNKIVIIVDDGVATGSTLEATIELVRSGQPAKMVIAVPVGPFHTINNLGEKADEVVCLQMPEDFYAIGQFYENFSQVEDEEVIRLLAD